MAKKVLIYNIGMLGDVLTTIPAHRAIRRHFGPDSRLTLLQLKVPAGRITPGDVLLPQGLVDEVMEYERGGKVPIKELQALLKLKTKRFDALCYLAPYPRSAKQVERDRVFFGLAGIKELHGFQSMEESVYSKRVNGQPDPRFKLQVLSRLDRLATGGIKGNDDDLATPWLTFSADQIATVDQWLSGRNQAGLPLIAFGIKTARTCNDWPLERFAEVGSQLLNEGLGLPIIVGGPGESELADALIQQWGSGLNACGAFSPMGSGALLARCRLMIGLDTGTTHLARAAGTPVVGIYGDRGPQTDWHPYGREVRVLRAYQSCGGCMAEDCPVAGHPCMTQITVPMVMEAVKNLLSEVSGYGRAEGQEP